MFSLNIFSRSRINRIIIYATVTTTILFLSAAGSNVAVLSFSDQGSATSSIPAACAPPPSGLISWYRAEGNALDVTENNPGLLRNGASITNGYVGQGFSFDGVDDFIDIGDVGQLQNASEITVMAWIKPNNTVPSIAGIVGKWSTSSGSNNTFLLNLGPNSAAQNGAFFVQFSDGSNAWVTGQTPVPTNAWTHIAGTWRNSDGALTIYKNGVADGTVTVGTGKVLNYLTNYTARIGEFGSNSFYFPGLIDEPMIAGRALPPGEIQTIYNADSAGICHVCAPQPNGLVGRWPGDGNPLDIQGPTFENGSLVNGTTYVAGMVGQAFSFDGNDDRIDIGGTPIELGSAPFTVDFWMKTPDASHVTHAYLLGKSHPDGGAGWDIRVGSNAIAVVGVNGWSENITSDASITNDIWHHVAVTSNGTTVELYIDGVLKGTCSRSPISSTGNPTRFGFTTNFGGLPFNGLLDEVEIFDRGLSQTEIQSIYNAGSLGFCDIGVPVPVGLVSWWSGDGNALDPRSGLNGVLQNGVTYTSGIVDSAFNIPGGSAVVEIPDRTEFDLSNTAFSIESWVKFNSVSATNVIVAHDNGGGGQEKWIFWQNGGSLQLHLNGAGGPIYIGVPFSPSIAEWYHLSVTKSGSVYRFYVNGIQAGSDQIDSSLIPNSNAALTIGKAEALTSINGVIDELSIYDRALSAAEVGSIANAGKAGKLKPTATTPPSGMVGWWDGNGNAVDSSGNGNIGDLINGATYNIGKVGQAFGLDGVNDYVEVPHSSSLNFGPTQPMSFDVWLKRTSTEPYQPIFTKRPDCFVELHYYFAYYAADNSLFFGSTGAPANGVSTTADKLPLNTWTHVSVSFDGANATMYINGEAVATHAMTFYPNTAPLAIGGQPTCGHYFGGMIDELTFYNRALSAAEIQSVYNAGLAGKLKQTATFATAMKSRTMRPTSVGTNILVGDATINFPSIIAGGVTQEIPLDVTKLPALPAQYISFGLTYDIATSAAWSGGPTVCFNVPALSSRYQDLRILHLENGSWFDRTVLGGTSPNLCSTGLTILSPFAIANFGPTAASVSVSGRVMTAYGNGVRNAIVQLTDQEGVTRTARTGSFGYYRFEDVQAGETYVISVASKRFVFTPRTITVSDELTDLDLVEQGQ